jgi:hypothetical protein
VDEGLAGGEDAGGDGLGDGGGGAGVVLEGEEGLADGEFDLLRDVGNDLLVAADDADGGGGAGAGGDLAAAVEEEALGDVVGLGVDEDALDELVEVVEREADGGGALGLEGEAGGDFLDDAADEGLGLGGEDVALIAAGEVDVDEGWPRESAISPRSNFVSPSGARRVIDGRRGVSAGMQSRHA